MLLHIYQQPLAQAALWTLGEFGDLPVNKQVEEEEPIDVSWGFKKIKSIEVNRMKVVSLLMYVEAVRLIC